MTRYFNTEGLCTPEEHYMVRLDDRMAQIKRKLVDRKKYFVINRADSTGRLPPCGLWLRIWRKIILYFLWIFRECRMKNLRVAIHFPLLS